MSGPYEDIIYLPHHVSTDRPRMSMTDRAAQFSPFAALTGYDAAIQETGRLTDRSVDLDVDGKGMLNEKLQLLLNHQAEQPEITVTYFVPDGRKSGGAYVAITGRVKKVDTYNQTVVMADGTTICFDSIYDLGGTLLQQE